MDETSIAPKIRTALAKVADGRNGVSAAIAREADAVRAARRSGVTWERIGLVYGISKQAASTRWPQPAERPW